MGQLTHHPNMNRALMDAMVVYANRQGPPPEFYGKDGLKKGDILADWWTEKEMFLVLDEIATVNWYEGPEWVYRPLDSMGDRFNRDTVLAKMNGITLGCVLDTPEMHQMLQRWGYEIVVEHVMCANRGSPFKFRIIVFDVVLCRERSIDEVIGL